MTIQDTLRALERFDSDGRPAISLYLDVSTPQLRNTIKQRLVTQTLEAVSQPGCPFTLSDLDEDLEAVELYLGTSAAKAQQRVAIFSCAAQLFWRALPLDHLDEEHVSVGTTFALQHLHPEPEKLRLFRPNASGGLLAFR